ncbi:hypothetical protein [Insolitispirillum peregrinum]|uniref:hypothetical protein n=1 Tax=Insolitispirillum peregrinum TaxID=80876 RepID=UPI00361C0F10
MRTELQLNNLLALAHREPWHTRFLNVLQEHTSGLFDPATEGFGEIEHLLEDDQISSLWNTALDDLLTRDFPDKNKNITDTYLRNYGRKESLATQDYIKALRTAVPSLYEVCDVASRHSITLRDLLRPGEPITVMEEDLFHDIAPSGILATRIISLSGQPALSSYLLLYSPKGAEELQTLLRDLHQKQPGGIPPVFSDDELRRSAPLFTSFWLGERLQDIASEATRTYENSDGEELLFHRICYPLAKGVLQKQLVGPLNTLPCLQAVQNNVWNWVAPADVKPSPTASNEHALRLITTLDSGEDVRGIIRLKGKTLTVETNSAERAATIQEILARETGHLLRSPDITIKSLEDLEEEEEDDYEDDRGENLLTPDEQAEILQQYIIKHYQGLLTKRIPFLGDKTPCQAIETAQGRQDVAEWLNRLEQGRLLAPGVPEYDFSQMWDALGISDLRQK